MFKNFPYSETISHTWERQGVGVRMPLAQVVESLVIILTLGAHPLQFSAGSSPPAPKRGFITLSVLISQFDHSELSIASMLAKQYTANFISTGESKGISQCFNLLLRD